MSKFDVILENDLKSVAEEKVSADLALVKNGLSNYLGFNVNDLWTIPIVPKISNQDHANGIVAVADGRHLFDGIIFGGAVRDCLAKLEIHDVDIMALPASAKALADFLLNVQFENVALSTVDVANLYLTKHINEPWTFVKPNCIVQIIRPVLNMINSPRAILKKCVESVDLSCCGVAYEAGNLYETVAGAISQCKNKLFCKLKNNSFYNETRTAFRTAKLMDRGWKEFATQSFSNKSCLSCKHFVEDNCELHNVFNVTCDHYDEVNKKNSDDEFWASVL